MGLAAISTDLPLLHPLRNSLGQHLLPPALEGLLVGRVVTRLVLDLLLVDLHEVLQDCDAVHVQHDQRAHEGALELAELHPDDAHGVRQLPLVELDVLLHGLGVLSTRYLVEGDLREPGPPDLVDLQLGLRGVGAVKQPLCAVGAVLGIPLEQRHLSGVVQALDHRSLDLGEPLLDDGSRDHGLDEGHALLDQVGHRDDVCLRRRVELHAVDGVEALAHVLLHGVGVPRLGEDAEQLVVGKEVETGEGRALRLQVGLQPLLHHLEGLVRLL
mmetsp:Transcript_33775/g.89516  ORF Transcript_33775/g.89516 Transcript_33775/m.89516 type:complete len:271 (+) Transcript_33775:327-1139(+)